MVEIDDVSCGQVFRWWMLQARNQVCEQVFIQVIQVTGQRQADLGIQTISTIKDQMREEVQDQHHGN